MKSTFNFTVPWLSWLAIITLLIVSFILYMLPLRYLILVWGKQRQKITGHIFRFKIFLSLNLISGINKFTKILRKPKGYIDNTEILDFLSRVPSNQEIVQYREAKFIRTSTSIQSYQNLTNTKENKKKLKNK